MICYYHPDRPAVGVCSHCGRGVCSECAATVDDVLACNARHEEQVRRSNHLLRRQIMQADRLKAGYLRNAFFYCLIGAVFLGFGALQYRFLGLQAVFFMIIGLGLIYAGVANYLESRSF